MIAVLARYYPRGLAAHIARTLLQKVERPRGRTSHTSGGRHEAPAASDGDSPAAPRAREAVSETDVAC